jgi:uncharacterized protein YkwD
LLTAIHSRFLRAALVLAEALLALLIAQPAYPSAASGPSRARPVCETVSALQSQIASWAAPPLDHKPPTATPEPTTTPTPVPPDPTPSLAPQREEPSATQVAVVASGMPVPATTALPPPTPMPVSPAPTAAPPPVMSVCGQRLIPLINKVRIESGLSPLVESPLLSLSAQQFAEFIAFHGIFSHTADGRTLDARAESAGYTGWTMLGENLAEGYATPEEAVTAWLASDGHRANILNPSFTETGVGCASNAASPYGYFWVQEFGSP